MNATPQLGTITKSGSSPRPIIWPQAALDANQWPDCGSSARSGGRPRRATRHSMEALYWATPMATTKPAVSPRDDRERETSGGALMSDWQSMMLLIKFVPVATVSSKAIVRRTHGQRHRIPTGPSAAGISLVLRRPPAANIEPSSRVPHLAVRTCTMCEFRRNSPDAIVCRC